MKNNENVRLEKPKKGKNCLHLVKKGIYTEGLLVNKLEHIRRFYA
jgi:hypothetical protein